jgi:hypothetical protein
LRNIKAQVDPCFKWADEDVCRIRVCSVRAATRSAPQLLTHATRSLPGLHMVLTQRSGAQDRPAWPALFVTHEIRRLAPTFEAWRASHSRPQRCSAPRCAACLRSVPRAVFACGLLCARRRATRAVSACGPLCARRRATFRWPRPRRRAREAAAAALARAQRHWRRNPRRTWRRSKKRSASAEAYLACR